MHMISIPKLKGWPNQDLFLKYCGKHVPFQSCETDFSNCHESVLAFLKDDAQIIDISCAEIGEVFHGNPSRREKVDMKASDFVDAWMLARAGQPHWSLSTGLNLYLSQHGLPKVGEYSNTFCCPIPAIIMESNGVIEQMNLWMNIFPASTTLHYDANNNILVVLEGQKDVTLFSPSATKFLKPAAAHNEYPNHSALTPEEADQLVDSLRTEATDTTDCLAYSVTLSAGDALFIPEGWWHQVRSQKCTMALNFWFHSDLRPLLVLPSEVESSDGTMAGVDMSSYLLRASLRKAVAAQKLTDNQKRNKQEHRGSSYPDNLTFDQFCHYAHECLSLGKETPTAVGSKRKQSTADPLTDFVACDIQTMRKFWIPFANAVIFLANKFCT